MICVPLHGDQLFNQGVAIGRNIGVVLKKTELTSEIVAAAIRRLGTKRKRARVSYDTVRLMQSTRLP